MTTKLTRPLAERFVDLTLGHLGREYPNKLDHVMESADDARTPIELHPAFYGSFDWHSCVHGWWQVMYLLRRFPDMPAASLIRERADRTLSPDNLAAELAYLGRPTALGFERPYGWAWLLALHGELAMHPARRWAEAVEPLARAFAERFTAFLPKLTYPIRHGIHSNSAFSLLLAHAWAVDHDARLAVLIAERALFWFADDQACQAWEPSGDEFLSPSLCEALLMARIMSADRFSDWFGKFLPHIADGEPATLLAPAFVSDRSDGKIAHLDGLNLSRAWCWRGIAERLGGRHPAAATARTAADRHYQAGAGHIAGDYMGEHWLATFALLALAEGPTPA